MPSVRSLLLVGLQCLYIAVAHCQPEPGESNLDFSDAQDFKQLLDQLPAESLHAAMAGHLGPKYQDGIFEADSRAMEHIHSDNPSLATRLVEIAKHDVAVKAELRKRQNTNGTVTSATSSDSTASTASTTGPDSSTTALSSTTDSDSASTSTASADSTSSAPTVVPVTTTDASGSTTIETSSAITAATPSASSAASVSSADASGVIIPIAITTTDSHGSTVTSETSALAQSASVSVEQTFTTTNSRGETVTTSSRFPGAVVTTTNSKGSTVTTTSPVASVLVGNSGTTIVTEAAVPNSSGASASGRTTAPDVTTTDAFGNAVVLSHASYGEVITATDAKGSTFITTFTPVGGAVKSLVLETVTAANGAQSTVTSFAVIGGAASPTSQAQGTSSSSRTASSSPGLQTGAASATRGYAKEVVALLGGAVGVAYLL